jgi:zinc and cadmium transporter
MIQIWIYTLASVLLVSLLSFIGILTLSIKANKLKKILIYFISFSAGALFAGAFIHLLPELIEEIGSFNIRTSLLILLGIILFFGLEKIVHWNHCHMPITKTHVHPFAIMNLIGDAFHNFLDGLVIAAAYLLNIGAGIATTIAVILHEIPQEIGDFGILLHGGFSKSKALLLNFITALTAIIGAIIALIIGNLSSTVPLILVPITIGGFIYIAGSDLIPELHKQCSIKQSLLQALTFILGIAIMAALLFLEVH